MPEILHGPVAVDDLVMYKGAGISPELIPKAAPKLLGTKQHRIPRRFYSRVRQLHIAVSAEPDTFDNGIRRAGEVRIAKFKDGRFTTSDRTEIAAIENSSLYGVDVFDIDEMDAAVEEKNIGIILDMVGKNPKAKGILQAQAVDDFLKTQTAKEEPKAPKAPRAKKTAPKE